MPVRNEIDVLAFDRDLRQTYERYIYTTNLISDQEPELQQEFSRLVSEEFSIFHGPYVHCTPSYKSSFSLRELIAGKASVSVSPALARLPREEFDPDRPLYSHQVEAIQILERGENLVVATGTGSGKTECFLLPILNDILANPGPGLRAIMIYPMNALADDQLRRLRRLLLPLPEITFGRYTGDTPEMVEEVKRPAEAVPNERYTRREIRGAPPHILLTNFAMLEYLLLRPRDSEIFAQNRLRFIVLDEAHTYSGAQGIEIALLMRRVTEYLLEGNRRVQFVLTSATLGDDGDAAANVARFGNEITGLPFERRNVLQGETVDEFADKLDSFPDAATLIHIGQAVEAFESWSAALGDAGELQNRLVAAGITTGSAEGRLPAQILYEIFAVSEPLNRIHERCRRPRPPSPNSAISSGFQGLRLDNRPSSG